MPTLNQYITTFLEYLEIEKGRSRKTIQNYDFYLRRFATWAKHPAVQDITPDLIHRFRLWLNRSLIGRFEPTIKKNTQNYHLIALRSFLKYLAKQDIQSLAPEKIELAKSSIRSVEFLEEEELSRFLEAPIKTKNPLDKLSITALRDKSILEALFSTGLRVSELSHLTIEQVMTKRNEFT
ncbi:hypothetical protein CO172_00825, partial [Candidatus Uhrbacteria bacterium CG_4_9_14_3_um_filter_36_7]